MIQFAYQPAFDPFHTVYRIFRVLDRLDHVEFEKGRIIDFYLLFPFRMADIRFKRGDLGCRKTALAYEGRQGYAIQPASRALFDRMRPVYEAAVQTMAVEGYLDAASLAKGVLFKTEKPVPADLCERISVDNGREQGLFDCLATLLQYDVLGNDGLKARTGLMEHRNDAA